MQKLVVSDGLEGLIGTSPLTGRSSTAARLRVLRSPVMRRPHFHLQGELACRRQVRPSWSGKEASNAAAAMARQGQGTTLWDVAILETPS